MRTLREDSKGRLVGPLLHGPVHIDAIPEDLSADQIERPKTTTQTLDHATPAPRKGGPPLLGGLESCMKVVRDHASVLGQGSAVTYNRTVPASMKCA